MGPTGTSDNTVSTELLAKIEATIQRAVHAEMAKWTDRLEEAFGKIESLQAENEQLKKENVALKMDISTLATTGAIIDTDREVYSRKWNLIISGVPGPKGEQKDATEEKVV
jgi:FtsZ-binding cell division protein ZapB